MVAIALGLISFGITIVNKHNKKIEAQRDTDFGPSIKQFQGLKSTVPAALVSNNNHILVMDKSGNTMLYCSDQTNCIGVGKDKLQTTIYDLFKSMAERSRADQAKAHPQQGPSITVNQSNSATKKK